MRLLFYLRLSYHPPSQYTISEY